MTVAYLAVLREVTGILAGADAADAALVPISDIEQGALELAFDHAQIVRDALERVRVDLELRGIATAFVGPTFTLAELRAVYEAVWGVRLDGANFRRCVLSRGWVIPTGRQRRPHRHADRRGRGLAVEDANSCAQRRLRVESRRCLRGRPGSHTETA